MNPETKPNDWDEDLGRFIDPDNDNVVQPCVLFDVPPAALFLDDDDDE